MRERVPQCGRVFPNVEGCTPVREGVPQCGSVSPTEGGCAPVWEGVPQCGKVCLSVRGCAPVCDMCACEVWLSLSHVLMTDTQVHLCVHFLID